MKLGKPYYAIIDARTQSVLFDWLGEAIGYPTREDAEKRLGRTRKFYASRGVPPETIVIVEVVTNLSPQEGA